MSSLIIVITALVVYALYQHIINKLDVIIAYQYDIDKVINPRRELTDYDDSAKK